MTSGLFTAVLRRRTAVLAGLAMATVMTAAHADDLVTNGSFSSMTNGTGQLGFNTNVTGWSVPNPNVGGSYAFVFSPGEADTIGVTSQNGNLQLWGSGNGGITPLQASPDGGNFVAMDGAFQQGAISQTINDLISGDSYTVSFDWAAAQQAGFTGDTTEQFQVSFGAETQLTGFISDASHASTDWTNSSFTFTADGSSDVLSFLALGTPNGVPPFALLDGVSVDGPAATPEPSSLALLATGLLGAGGMLRRRFMKA